MFGQAPDLDLVGSVENGEDVIEAVKRLRPEVVIMDVRLPGIDGISAVKRIAEAAPEVKTVMFSAYGDKRLLSDAIAAGASGPTCDIKSAGDSDGSTNGLPAVTVRIARSRSSGGEPFMTYPRAPAAIASDSSRLSP